MDVTFPLALHMSAFGGRADIGLPEKVLQLERNLLNHLARKKQSFESKLLRCLETTELPKLHTRVRFPSPAPSLVSFRGQSGHDDCAAKCLLLTQNGRRLFAANVRFLGQSPSRLEAVMSPFAPDWTMFMSILFAGSPIALTSALIRSHITNKYDTTSLVRCGNAIAFGNEAVLEDKRCQCLWNCVL